MGRARGAFSLKREQKSITKGAFVEHDKVFSRKLGKKCQNIQEDLQALPFHRPPPHLLTLESA